MGTSVYLVEAAGRERSHYISGDPIPDPKSGNRGNTTFIIK